MIYMFFAVVGAAMGSFCGATVWRIRQNKDFVKDRSECEHCHHKLGALDLIPILSYVFLRGKCRYCHTSIGATTLVIELIGAGIFVASYALFPLAGVGVAAESTALFVLWLAILVGFMMLGLYDSLYKLLPNKILFPVMGLAGVYFMIFNFWSGDIDLISILSKFILSLLPITGFYGLLYWMSERKGKHMIGFGDVKLGVIIAFILSWEGSFIVLFLANVLGALFSLALIAFKRQSLHSMIPFGPFLLLATVLVFLLQINLENVMTFMYNI